MKSHILIALMLSVACMHMKAQSDTLRFDPEAESSDSVEYELIVLDPGYDIFLQTQPQMDFYSQAYYEFWNALYVSEWNYRHMQPLNYGPIYEVYIDYHQQTDYGMELNYKLFYYFRFFEKEHGVDLLPGKVF